MNKAYLLVVCLLAASFTGCVDSPDDDDLTSEIEQLTNQNKNLNELLTNQTANNDALNSDIAKLNEQLANQTDDNDDLTSEIANLTAQIQSLNERISILLPFQPQNEYELSNAKYVLEMFYETSEKWFGDINSWDTSLITDMSSMFQHNLAYYDHSNHNISAWNVSNVTDMESMFLGATSFNQDISGWDVSSVTDMSYMFYSAESFNQDISTWDVSNVTNMQDMFYGTDGLSDDNMCAIHNSFDSNSNWPYHWDETCSSSDK